MAAIWLKICTFAAAAYVAHSCTNTCRYANDNDCDEPSTCSAGTDCADCGVDYRTAAHRRRLSGSVGGTIGSQQSTYTYHSGCSWSSSDSDDFVAKIMAGSIIAAILGIIFVALASLPLCCGIMKKQAKIIAGFLIFAGMFNCLIPYFASLSACDPVANDICGRCNNGCTAAEKTSIETSCNALGTIVVYTAAYGFAGVILGIVAAVLSCCILCNCCKMAPDVNGIAPANGGGNVVVVGQAVAGQAVAGQVVGKEA